MCANERHMSSSIAQQAAHSLSTDHRSLELLIPHTKHEDLASSRHIQVLPVSQSIGHGKPSPCTMMARSRLDKKLRASIDACISPVLIRFGTYEVCRYRSPVSLVMLRDFHICWDGQQVADARHLTAAFVELTHEFTIAQSRRDRPAKDRVTWSHPAPATGRLRPRHITNRVCRDKPRE